jgi:hypothetical protein
MEGKMFPRFGDAASRTNLLTTIASALLMALLIAAVVKFDLWKVPEDQSAASLFQSDTTPAVATALKAN